jgi:hypothetical protein
LHTFFVGTPAHFSARNFYEFLYPNTYLRRCGSSAIRWCSLTNTNHTELRFRALLTEGASEVELALV